MYTAQSIRSKKCDDGSVKLPSSHVAVTLMAVVFGLDGELAREVEFDFA